MSTSKSKSKIFLNNKRNLRINKKDSYKSFKSNSKQILNKGPWTEKEDQLLINWVTKNGACNWTKCSDYIKGRSGKQCREHWNNSLDPTLTKGQWTSEEDLLIMIFYKKYGGSWKKIIPIFERRTENSIKNRFFSQLRKFVCKYQQSKKKEYSYKYGLEELKKFLPQATELARKKFYSENTMNENEFEEYINKIDNMVKNKKKGNKFIDLNLIRNKNNFIELEENKKEIENKEKIIYENEENLETTSKKRGRKKSVEKKQNKIKEEAYENNKEEQMTNEETVYLLNKSNKDINNNNENNNSFVTKKSIKEINFKKEEKVKNNDDYFIPPMNINNTNTINNKYVDNYYKKFLNNKNNKNTEYKIKEVSECDLHRKSTMEDEFQSNDKKAINHHQKIRNNCMKNISSKKIENYIENGKNLSPFPSYGEIEYKESFNIYHKKKSKKEEKIERKNSNKYFCRQSSYGNNLAECNNILATYINHNVSGIQSISKRASFL